jgi:glycosyltransferase involved in cell wall biosynthesis
MRHFQIVLEALRDQTLAKDQWELIVVDDASRVPLRAAKRDDLDRSQFDILKDKESVGENSKITKSQIENAEIDLSWHPNARLVETDPEREGLGLVSARLRGFELGKGDVFVFVDQDNALRPNYLQGVADIAVEYPQIGTWGGQILLKFDEPDKAPEKRLWASLCTREFDDDVWSNVVEHHASTPCGAGLCARREVLAHYRAGVLENPMRRLLDPTPRGGGFGGDTDIAFAGIRAGYGKGIFSRLVLDHLTPAGRCADQYIINNAEGLSFSSGLHGYIETGRISPPRDDWRFWLMNWARRPTMKRLEWELLLARQRGRLRAIKEMETNSADWKTYAQRLHEKAVALNQRTT